MQRWSKDGVRQERTGWRCEAISARHRHWGYNCPAVDLDFLVAEYNYGKPCALVEYKEKHAQPPTLNHPTYRALNDLASNYAGISGGLPFFIAIYCAENWWFRVIPVNQKAKDFLTQVSVEQGVQLANTPITEQWFVYTLYRLRKSVLEQADCEVIARLNSILPTTQEAA